MSFVAVDGIGVKNLLRGDLYTEIGQKFSMPVEYNGQEMSKHSAVSLILAEYNVDLNPAGRQYLDQMGMNVDIPGVDEDNLLLYLISNVKVVDKDSRLAKKKLKAVSDGDSPDAVELKETRTNVITEDEFGDIMSGFEAVTEKKVQRGELLSLQDFEAYAEQTGYAVEKVLYANSWVDSVIEPEVLSKIEDVEEELTVAEEFSDKIHGDTLQ
jgi:hypothetical protein